MENTEALIKQYVNEVIAYPTVNTLDIADKIFGEDPLPNTFDKQNLAIPELAEIPSVKRQLVVSIIKLKANVNTAVSDDMFTSGVMILVDKQNHKEA